MRGCNLIHRVCLLRRWSRVAVQALYVVVPLWWALVCWPAPGGAEPLSTIGVELNRLEDQGGNCRVYLVITNPGAAEFSSFALDLVVFDRGGTIMRRLAAEVAPLRPAKTSLVCSSGATAANCSPRSLPYRARPFLLWNEHRLRGPQNGDS